MNPQPADLVYPMIALAGWTFLVMLRNLQVRVAAMNSGELPNRYFELFQGAEPSEVIVKTGNHVRNLFEFPVLFYTVCLAVIATEQVDSLFVWLAWTFVILRVAHGLVHLTVNRVPLRFAFFILGVLAVMIMWIRLALLL